MKSIADKAIVLSRTNYGEKDRIITFLTEKNGKLSTLAKSVRGQKSRLAGGVELFSISEISYIAGKSDLRTLTGARLVKHFGSITKDLDKSNLAYDMLKVVGKLSEDGHGQEYFRIVSTAFSCLDDISNDPILVYVWFGVQSLHEMGVLATVKPDHIPKEVTQFNFDYSDQRFVPKEGGLFSQNDLKLLDLSLKSSSPIRLEVARDLTNLASLIRSLLKTNVFEV